MRTQAANASRRTLIALLAAALLCAPLLASPASAAPSSEAAAFPGQVTTQALPGRYIVELKPDDQPNPQQRARAAARQTASGRVDEVYQEALRGFVLDGITRQEADRLASEPFVIGVTQDQQIKLPQPQSSAKASAAGVASWGLDRIDQRGANLNRKYRTPENGPGSGAGVNVYVIDTGIYPEHTDFGGRAQIGFDAFGQDGRDCQGHGTHVAGTIAGSRYGVAKQATIHGVRVLGCQGVGTLSGVIAGVEWVTANHQKPAVANMSLGGPSVQLLDNAVKRSIQAGVTYVVAAGNESQDVRLSSPARVKSAITVGATDRSDRLADFSNTGRQVDILAPGVQISSAWIDNPNASNTLDGTSMAAPHVAGAAARYLSVHPDATPGVVAGTIDRTSTRRKITGLPQDTANELLFTTRLR